MKKLVPVLLMALTLTACAPVKVMDVVEIRPNETAWAIPLDGSASGGQVKFNSVDFLNAKKVQAKRIMVDKIPRSIGRMWFDIEWLPAIRVIRVDRSLVTREWTDTDKTGSSAKSEAIPVVTRDSVQLKVGLTVTASIDEDDASTYLYYHGERPLADVLDQNIRSFCVAELTRRYSEMSLTEAQTNGPSIYNQLFSDAKETFKTKGISIQYLGNAEGLTYSDPMVQSSINKSYIVEQDKKTALQEQDATRIRNQTQIMMAEAQAQAAAKLFAAQQASEFQNQLKIQLMEAQARLSMATQWNGKLPDSILPSDSPLLLSLGSSSRAAPPAAK